MGLIDLRGEDPAGSALAVATAGRGNSEKTIPRAPAFTAAALNAAAGADWLTNGGSVTNQRYSALDQINKSNVGKLKLAWRIHLHSGESRAYSQEATPVVYKGVMYISTGNDDVFALNAATGKILWTYHSNIPVSTITTVCCGFSNRGVALGDGKVYIAQIPGQLVALDQQTGRVAWRVWNTRWQEGGTSTGKPAGLPAIRASRRRALRSRSRPGSRGPAPTRLPQTRTARPGSAIGTGSSRWRVAGGWRAARTSTARPC